MSLRGDYKQPVLAPKMRVSHPEDSSCPPSTISSIVWPNPRCGAVGQPAPPSISTPQQNWNARTITVIQLIFSLGFLCSMPGSSVRRSLTQTVAPVLLLSRLPPTLYPPRHGGLVTFFPGRKSFPLQGRNARIPPSSGKEPSQCNQRIFLCFIFFSRGNQSL